jgi:tetratricopeptide (TPR) repeat protein
VFFCTQILGAFGADPAALANFFDPPWHAPVAGLKEVWRAFLLNEAGYDLRALGRLAEAADPMRAGLAAAVAREDWKNAGVGAHNLSQLHLTLGDLAAAVEVARQAVAHADRSGNREGRLLRRAMLAYALHQAGQPDEAATLFEAAEALQRGNQPQFPVLYSLQGFWYCDLLLARGDWRAVLERAAQTLEWGTQYGSLLEIALGHLLLGRARLMRAQAEGGDCAAAAGELARAVDGLRQAGMQDYLPRGLLARAECHRLPGACDKARRDLDEALAIATRSGMRLFEADGQLECARLNLALDEAEAAHTCLAKARTLIVATGYHRRDAELAELEVQVGPHP